MLQGLMNKAVEPPPGILKNAKAEKAVTLIKNQECEFHHGTGLNQMPNTWLHSHLLCKEKLDYRGGSIHGFFRTQPAVFRISIADRAMFREILALLGLFHPIGDGFR